MRQVIFSLAVMTAGFATVSPAFADPSWFVEARVGPSWIEGNSNTTNGGAIFGGGQFGGEVVSNVDFRTGYSVGGTIGRSFGRDWSAGVSFDHMQADVFYTVTLPNFFNIKYTTVGAASSNLILLDLRRKFPITSRLSISATVGAGAAANRTKNMVAQINRFHPLVPLRLLNVTLEGDNITQFAARGAISSEFSLTQRMVIQLGGSIFRLGNFKVIGPTSPAFAPPLTVGGPTEPFHELSAWGFGANVGLLGHF